MTFGEIRFQLTKRCPGTDPDVLDGFINDAYQSIAGRHSWKGLEADGWIQTDAPYETGTIALVAASRLFTGTGTVFTAAMNQRGVYIPGRQETYRFNFIDATHGALDRPFEGGSSATSGFKLFQDIYELPDDYSRPFYARNQRIARELVHWDRKDVERMCSAASVFAEPQIYSIVTPAPFPELNADEENDRKRARLYPIPAYAAGYPYTYIRSVPVLTEGDTEVEILPWVSTKALQDLARAAVEADKKNYNGGLAYTASAELEINKMLIADAKLRGPQQIRMAEQYTRHRIARSARYGRGVRM